MSDEAANRKTITVLSYEGELEHQGRRRTHHEFHLQHVQDVENLLFQCMGSLEVPIISYDSFEPEVVALADHNRWRERDGRWLYATGDDS